MARVLAVTLLLVASLVEPAGVEAADVEAAAVEAADVGPANASLRVGRVVDAANVLSPTTEAQLTRRLADFEASSTVQVVVATVPSLEGKDIEEVANELGRRWGIGAKDTSNGVLLLIAPSERRVRIEVGYGLEGDLTDAKTSRIIRNRIVPAFKRGDLDAGVRDGVEGILETLGGEPVAAEEGGRVATEQVRHYAPAAIFWIFFLIILFTNLGGGRRRRRGLGRALFWASVLGGLPHDRSGGFRGGGGFGSGGGGGGFRGGGGSFGGGGASGSW